MRRSVWALLALMLLGLTSSQCLNQQWAIGAAMHRYADDHYGRYPANPQLLKPYLDPLPTCGGKPYRLEMASNPDLYTVLCGNRSHGSVGSFTEKVRGPRNNYR